MILEPITSIKSARDFCSDYFNDSSPFLEYDFFKLLEDSKCTNKDSGWIPKHLIFKENNKIVAFIPNFKKLNSFGEYIFDHIFEHAYYQTGSEYFPKFLSGIPFTPVTKLKFVYSKNSLDLDKILVLLIDFLEKSKISSFHANFINLDTSNKLENYNLYKRIGIQYHWKNQSFLDFNDYLDSMKSRKKKSIHKERKSLQEKGIIFSQKEGKMIQKKDMVDLYKCYLKTIDKKWSRPYLNLDFFEGLIKTQTINKMLLVSAYQNDKLLGSSIHFIGKDTLYGRYWGCLEEVPYLHFELCYYQAIEYAIKKKLSKIEAGAQGEHKISRGYEPCLIYSNHWFNNAMLNNPIKEFLKKENLKVIDTVNYLKEQLPFSEKSN